ncbi:hypothetical protein SLS55_003810 [Diplodia seriata]|uniref:Uncharacterized protein n=1 Tax=Diplodia seriata TaxID=420778 RepID=A0ABR3CNY7_9PEZI
MVTSSSISLYQQQAVKLLSRKSVVLGIPLAAGSIILFLQWRKRKSLKPKPKPKSRQPESEKKGEKAEEARTHGSNGKATTTAVEEEKPTSETPSASAQNGAATAPAATPAPTSSQSYAAVAAAPPSAAAPSPVPQYSPIRPKHPQDDADDQRVTGFAYAKRPRLGRGRSVEKFASYEPLRKASAEKREQEEKLRIKEEDDKAAAAAVAAFSPPASVAGVAVPEPEFAPAPAPAVAAVVPDDEDVPPEAPIPAAPVPTSEAAPEVASDIAPETPAEIKVNGWHHYDDDEPRPEPVRDTRRPSIIATFEITTSSEPANLSPPGTAAFDASRRPSVVTTISAEPAINEEDEDEEESENKEWEDEDEAEAEPTPAFPSRRESVTVETAIEIAEAWSNGMNGTIHEEEENAPAHGISTTISGPIPVTSTSWQDDEYDEDLAPEDPVPEPAASSALAKAMENGAQGDEQAKRTDSPLASKPVVVAAAAGVPAPQSAVVEEIRDVVERAPLAHLPGMGIPNRA